MWIFDYAPRKTCSTPQTLDATVPHRRRSHNTPFYHRLGARSPLITRPMCRHNIQEYSSGLARTTNSLHRENTKVCHIRNGRFLTLMGKIFL